MNRIILLLLFLSALCLLNAVTLEVSLDGTCQFTSIQSAVDASNNGDVIHVYPGRYYEHIDILEKTITIQSQYAVTNNREDIYNTIIDANYLSNCVRIENNSNATMNGFSFINGTGYDYGDTISYGGGISVNSTSSLNLENSIVEHNSATYTGGVKCNSSSTITLSGNIIRNNKAIYQGGGVGVYGSSIVFDSLNPNSIFNNYGDVQDIYIYSSFCSEIILDTLSVDITSPDGFFVSRYTNGTNPDPVISVQHSYFTQIDANLYVSPDGDDSNDGLTPETALRTIAYANRMVQPDSLNPNTVYLMPGVYSKELNNQFFPIALQSHTKMLGAGESPEEVVIGDEYDLNKIQLSFVSDIEIGNFHMQHNEAEGNEAPLTIYQSNNARVNSVYFSENRSQRTGVSINRSSNVALNDLIVRDISITNYYFTCISVYQSTEVLLSNCIVDNSYNSFEIGGVSGVNLDDSGVTINNLILSNNTRLDSGAIFQYTNTSNSSQGRNLVLNNLLMYNNYSSSSSLPMVIFGSRYEECFINNITIAYNSGPTVITRFGGDYTIRNSIIYNPEGAGDMEIWVPANGDSNPLWSNVDIDYSIVRNGLAGVSGADNPNNNVTWGSHNIDTNPLFRGDVEGNIPVGDPRWVQLSEFSPCVNAGTPDTLGINLPANDITGNPRIWDGIIDMGAHEYNPTVDNEENTIPVLAEGISVSHFPNPVFINGDKSGCAFIEFTLPKKPIEKPTLEIYNIKGQKVRNIKITQSFSQLVRSAGLSSEDKQSGEYYSQVWDCKDDHCKPVSSGIYFYKVSSEGKEALGKMMILK